MIKFKDLTAEQQEKIKAEHIGLYVNMDYESGKSFIEFAGEAVEYGSILEAVNTQLDDDLDQEMQATAQYLKETAPAAAEVVKPVKRTRKEKAHKEEAAEDFPMPVFEGFAEKEPLEEIESGDTTPAVKVDDETA